MMAERVKPKAKDENKGDAGPTRVEGLHVRYRPRTWDEVIGQGPAVKSLSGVIKRRDAQTFILSGPSGTGKTTLARIAARDLGCETQSILEIDAATHTGIESMREITQTMQYKSFGKAPQRAVIVDECHRLSKNAWDSLLKATEEPPEHVSWFFCTTDFGKVPATIKTRGPHIQLRLVSEKDLLIILDEVCDLEQIDISDDVADMVIKEARGSPRQMLVNLALCRDIKDKKTAASVLKTALESDHTLELCRMLANGSGSWSKVAGIIDKIDSDSYEGVRILVTNYIGSCLKKASDREVPHFLKVLDCFCTPFNPSEGVAPLYLAVGRVLYSE